MFVTPVVHLNKKSAEMQIRFAKPYQKFPIELTIRCEAIDGALSDEIEISSSHIKKDSETGYYTISKTDSQEIILTLKRKDPKCKKYYICFDDSRRSDHNREIDIRSITATLVQISNPQPLKTNG